MGLGLELRVVGEQTIHGAGCDRGAVKARGERAQDSEVNARRSPAASDP